VYANRPSGLGRLGRRLDRYLLDLPVHRAVRERFAAVTDRMTAAIESRLTERDGPVTVLSGPCGLVRDLCAVYEGVRRGHAEGVGRVRFFGLDLDYEGRVLSEARRRAGAAGVPVRLVRGNAMGESTWSWLREQAGPFAVVSCIGLAPWLRPEE